MATYSSFKGKTHRLIPSRFPPVMLFDWADSPEELEHIAQLEGLSNDRLKAEYGEIGLVVAGDWIGGSGATPLMASFTHPGVSRFSDGTYGVYYTADSLQTAIAETRYHREVFLSASNEPPCLIQMREYTTHVVKPLVDIRQNTNLDLIDPNSYKQSQEFGFQLKRDNEWGVLYPSVRLKNAICVAAFRPPALTVPRQGCHLEYVWDGEKIADIRKPIKLAVHT